MQLRTRDSLKLDQMPTALRDLSNSPDPYSITPRRSIKRRQSHPLNVISKEPNCQQSKSAPTSTSIDLLNAFLQSRQQNKTESNHLPQLDTPIPSHKTPAAQPVGKDPTETIDMRNPSSTLKSLSTMQIEYSPGPLTATQSLIALRQRLTTSLSSGVGEVNQSLDNPLYYMLNPPDKIPKNGITLSCNEQSPTLEGLLEEKSIFEQVSEKSKIRNALKRDKTKFENTVVSSLSEKLEWLRLNTNLKNDVNISKNDETDSTGNGQGTNCIDERKESEEPALKKKRDCDMLKRQKCVLRRKVRKNDRNGACGTDKAFSCDRVKPKTLEKPQLMGLTLPLGKWR